MEQQNNNGVKKLLKRLFTFSGVLLILVFVGIELFDKRIILGDSYVPILLAVPVYPLGILSICAYTWDETMRAKKAAVKPLS